MKTSILLASTLMIGSTVSLACGRPPTFDIQRSQGESTEDLQAYYDPLEDFLPPEQIRQMFEDPTGCRRWNNSYRSQWQLKDNQLWLVRLEQINCDGEAVEVSPEDLFGQTHYPILADWYNGWLLSYSAPTYDRRNIANQKFRVEVEYAVTVMEFSGGELAYQYEDAVVDQWDIPGDAP
ncbi:hypothetical protein [Pseudobowmanella zhangzhouensis]|uniref:Lipoprotein n=1 Tax=Pseudobowmanella zhangzhouensis TaxID=1537679 RepID=A0ABW1XJ02_9ALTE